MKRMLCGRALVLLTLCALLLALSACGDAGEATPTPEPTAASIEPEWVGTLVIPESDELPTEPDRPAAGESATGSAMRDGRCVKSGNGLYFSIPEPGGLWRVCRLDLATGSLRQVCGGGGATAFRLGGYFNVADGVLWCLTPGGTLVRFASSGGDGEAFGELRAPFAVRDNCAYYAVGERTETGAEAGSLLRRGLWRTGLDTETLRPRELAGAYISYDGERFYAGAATGGVAVLAANGAVLRTIDLDPGEDWFAEDGRVYYKAEDGEGTRVWVCDADTGESRALTGAHAAIAYFALDGGTLYIIDGGGSLYSVGADGTELGPLLADCELLRRDAFALGEGRLFCYGEDCVLIHLPSLTAARVEPEREAKA